MKSIFILEDMDERIDAYRKKFPTDTLTVARTAKEAIEILEKNLNFDLICLDHDLGLRAFVDSNDENTGYQVAKFLSMKYVSCPIIIHSLNPVGAKNMQMCLPQAKRIPAFFMFDEHNKRKYL
jgi:CheY-like chemotaxis protein